MNRRVAWVVFASLLFFGGACKKRVKDPTAVSSDHPDLHCPEGTVPDGTPPPIGLEVWCVVQRPDGTTMRHGPILGWYASGSQRLQGQYHAGLKTGDWIQWYANGKTEWEGAYVEDNKEGYWVAYHSTGTRAAAGEYLGGLENGPWTYWTDAGLKEREGSWNQGKEDGEWTSFAPDGRPMKLKVFRNGHLQSMKEL